MVKAYLKYEPALSFGVVTDSTAPVVTLPSQGRGLTVACPAVDSILVWSMRSGSVLTKLGNADTRRAGQVTVLSRSADGETLAAGYSDGSIRLWDVSNKALSVGGDGGMHQNSDEPVPLLTFSGHRSAISALCFQDSPEDLPVSKEGKVSSESSKRTAPHLPTLLASGSNDGDVLLWDTVGECGLFRLMAHRDMVTHVVLVQNSGIPYVISSSKDGLVRVYDCESQHCIQTVVGHHGEVWAMGFDSSLRLLITGTIEADLRLFSVFPEADTASNSGSGNDSTSTDDGFRSGVALVDLGTVQRSSAGGRVLHVSTTVVDAHSYVCVTASDRSCELFRLRSRGDAERHRRRRRQRAVEKAKRSSAAAEKDVSEGGGTTKELAARVGDSEAGTSDDRVLAKDFFVVVRSFKSSSKLRACVFAHASSSSVRLSTLRSASGNMNVAVSEAVLVLQLNTNALEAYNVQVSSRRKKAQRKKQKYRGRLDANTTPDVDMGDGAGGDEAVPLDDVELGKMDLTSSLIKPGNPSDVRSVVLTPDEASLLTVSRRCSKLWNVASGSCVRTISTQNSNLCSAVLTSDGRIVAVGSLEGTIDILDMGSGERLQSNAKAHAGAVWAMRLDADVHHALRLVTVSADRLMKVWDIQQLCASGDTAAPSRTLELPDEVLDVCVVSSRDEPVVVVSLMDCTVRAFVLSNFEPYMTFYGHKMPVLSLDVSSDGLLLATGSADKTIKIWGMDFGDCRRSLRAHDDSIQCVRFQPQTHYLFTGGRDGSLKYWDCDKFEYVASLDGQSGHVWSICVSADGECVASGGRDRLVRLWRRTDEQLFLEEEKDKRLDDMLESTLIDEDHKEAMKARSSVAGFMEDPSTGESLPAGKRSLENVKAGERVIEALDLSEAESRRLQEDPGEQSNPMMLGMTPDGFVLRALEQVRTAELEESLTLLPLDKACVLLSYCSRLLDAPLEQPQLSLELVCRTVLFIFKLHHNQIVAGAVPRELVASLEASMSRGLRALRDLFGFNASGLSFWDSELADKNDAAFRDASARAFNLQKAQDRKRKRQRS